MNMKGTCKLIVLFLCLAHITVAQQVKGYVYDETTQESLPGVNIFYKDKDGLQGTITNADGSYELAVPVGSVTINYSFLGYQTQHIPLVVTHNQVRTVNVNLQVESNLMDDVVVSVGRYEQKLSEITVSMELLKAGDVFRQAPTDLTAALKTVSGVEINDRQPSIRGGSGWTYGVGSRALIMVDGLSVLTPASGEINWNVVPMENVDQIEVIKGASSVLYGSSALNGLINVRTKRPALEPTTSIKTFVGIYGNPEKESYEWWDKSFWEEGKYPVTPLGRRNVFQNIKNPIYDGIDVSHSRRINNLDVTAGLNYFTDEGYRTGNYTNRFRVGGNLTYHDPRVDGLNYGLNLNFLANDYAGFFIWRSPEEAYTQSAFGNMSRQANMFEVTPFLNYANIDNNTTHRLKSRIYRQGNQIIQSSVGKSPLDIINNMGFNYNDIPEIADMAQNWQTTLLPKLLPHLPGILNGDYAGAVNEIAALGNRYFPTAKPADYMDLISWVMGHTPIPTTTDALIPWAVNNILGEQTKTVPPTDYTTSYYVDYQFSKKYDNAQLTAGSTYEHVYADSQVTGQHRSDNIGLFMQYDRKFFDRLNVSAGVRMEYYRVDDQYREAETDIFGISMPFKPVFRGGLNYELAEYSFIRASFGQGYRYPSVVEKYVLKDIGGIGAYPNANLKAERGYNAELGIKQGYKLGGLKGFVDVAGFYTRYYDMIEFRIGLFDKKTFDYLTGLDEIIATVQSGDGIGIGAQFNNVGDAEIYGLDASVMGMYEFNPETKFTFNLGYVYSKPIDLDNDARNAVEEADTDILAMRSKSNDSKYLKYRQKHSVKGVFDFEWKRLSVGTNLAWKSKTLAVDYFFVDERDKNRPNLMDYARSMLFGDLHDYWIDHNTGYFTMDLRAGIKFSKSIRLQVLINNLLDTEYSARPMDVAAPRTYVTQLNFDF